MKLEQLVEVSLGTSAKILSETANISFDNAKLLCEAKTSLFEEVNDVESFIESLLNGEVPNECR